MFTPEEKAIYDSFLKKIYNSQNTSPPGHTLINFLGAASIRWHLATKDNATEIAEKIENITKILIELSKRVVIQSVFKGYTKFLTDLTMSLNKVNNNSEQFFSEEIELLKTQLGQLKKEFRGTNLQRAVRNDDCLFANITFFFCWDLRDLKKHQKLNQHEQQLFDIAIEQINVFFPKPGIKSARMSYNSL